MPSCAVGDVPREPGVVQLVRVNFAVVDGRVSLVDVRVARQHQVDAVLHQEWLEHVFAGPTDCAGRIGMAKIPRPVAGRNNPWGLSSVDTLEIGFQPLIAISATVTLWSDWGDSDICLGIHGCVERSGIIAFRTAWLVIADEAVAQVGFSIELHKVNHAVIKRVPEVPRSSGFSAWHAKMVAVTSEVSLARHTDAVRVCDIASCVSGSAIVAIGFVIARTDHVGFVCSDWSHLIVEVVEDGLVDNVTICNGRVWQKALYFLL